MHISLPSGENWTEPVLSHDFLGLTADPSRKYLHVSAHLGKMLCEELFHLRVLSEDTLLVSMHFNSILLSVPADLHSYTLIYFQVFHGS